MSSWLYNGFHTPMKCSQNQPTGVLSTAQIGCPLLPNINQPWHDFALGAWVWRRGRRGCPVGVETWEIICTRLTHTHYNIYYIILCVHIYIYIYNISTCEIYIHICLSVLYVHDTATSSLRYLDSGALEHDFVCFNWAPLGSCGRSIIDPRMQSQHESTAAKLAT